MKKILCFIVAFALLMTCTACKSGNTVSDTDSEYVTEYIVTESGEKKAVKSKVTETDDERIKETSGGNMKENTISGDNGESKSKTGSDGNKNTTSPKTNPSASSEVQGYTETSSDGIDLSGFKKSSINSLINNSKLNIIGRAGMCDGVFQMDWVNTGFEFAGDISGDVYLHTVSDRFDSILNIVIDGGEPTLAHIKKGESDTKIASGLKSGSHTLKVISGTSLRFGNLSATLLYYKGTINKIPKSSALKIEVLGDSISCGWGLDLPLGKSYGQDDQVSGSNSYYSYASITARNLGADLSVVAQCALNISEINGFFPLLNERTNAPLWDFSKNPQDIVIINLGTNDQWRVKYAPQAETDAKTIISNVRSAYPNAYIIWCYNMMPANSDYESAYINAVKSFTDKGDKKIFTLKFESDSSCFEGHPSRVAHEKNAQKLTAFIKSNCADVLK